MNLWDHAKWMFSEFFIECEEDFGKRISDEGVCMLLITLAGFALAFAS